MTLPQDAGPWYRPAQAKDRIGRSARFIRELCQDGLIDHRQDVGPSGAVRYLISQQAIDRYVSQTVVPAKRRAA